MNIDDDEVQSIIISWVVLVTILFGILLPFSVNVPTLPALFLKLMMDQANGPPIFDYTGGPIYSGNSPDLLVYYDFEGNLTGPGFPDQSLNLNPAFINGILVNQGPGIIGKGSLFLSGTGFLYCNNDPVAGRTNVSISLWYTVNEKGYNYWLAGGIMDDESRPGWMVGTRTSELRNKEGNPIRVREMGRHLSWSPLSMKDINFKVLVYNGSYITEYLNGGIIGEFAASGEPIALSRWMRIGSWEPFGENYSGRIDEFRVYSKPLSAKEVSEAYNAGLEGRAA